MYVALSDMKLVVSTCSYMPTISARICTIEYYNRPPHFEKTRTLYHSYTFCSYWWLRLSLKLLHSIKRFLVDLTQGILTIPANNQWGPRVSIWKSNLNKCPHTWISRIPKHWFTYIARLLDKSKSSSVECFCIMMNGADWLELPINPSYHSIPIP